MPSTPGFKGHQPKDCGCKGIRTCYLCRTPSSSSEFSPNKSQRTVYKFCTHCQKAHPTRCQKLEGGENLTSCTDNKLSVTSGNSPPVQYNCSQSSNDTDVEFPGIFIIENFVSRDEENELVEAIMATAFMKSQSGRHKQDFGPKVNFKKQKLKTGAFCGLPSYSQFLYERMKACEKLSDFEPVEMCNLEYSSDRGAHIDPHIDDTWVWGDRLVTLNLVSDSILSFTHDSQADIVVQVPLNRTSLLVVSGPARFEWKHGIDAKDISGQRIAMTFRELASEFLNGGMRAEEGRELLDLALTFQGCAVGSGL